MRPMLSGTPWKGNSKNTATIGHLIPCSIHIQPSVFFSSSVSSADKYTPHIWDYLYDNEDVQKATREIRELFNTYQRAKSSKILKRIHAALLCLHPALPCGWIAPETGQRKITGIPLVAVLTDFAIHSYWLYPEVDVYLVAHENLKRFSFKKALLLIKSHYRHSNRTGIYPSASDT